MKKTELALGYGNYQLPIGFNCRDTVACLWGGGNNKLFNVSTYVLFNVSLTQDFID